MTNSDRRNLSEQPDVFRGKMAPNAADSAEAFKAGTGHALRMAGAILCGTFGVPLGRQGPYQDT